MWMLPSGAFHFLSRPPFLKRHKENRMLKPPRKSPKPKSNAHVPGPRRSGAASATNRGIRKGAAHAVSGSSATSAYFARRLAACAALWNSSFRLVTVSTKKKIHQAWRHSIEPQEQLPFGRG